MNGDVSTPFVIYHAGESGHSDAVAVRNTITQCMRTAGVEVRFMSRAKDQSVPEALCHAFDEASRCSGTVVIAGGDGTINCAVTIALKKDKSLGIIPIGTFNFVGRSHAISESVEEAAAILLSEKPRATRVARVGQQIFMVNASMGSYARLQRERENFKHAIGRSRTVATLAAIWSALRTPWTYRVQLTQDGMTRRQALSTLIFCNNRLQLEMIGVDSLPSHNTDQLVCATLDPVGVWSQLKVIWQGWRGKVSEVREMRSFIFNQLTVDVPTRRSRRISIAVDGELHKMALPLHITVNEKPVRLIRPPFPGEDD